MLIVHSIALTQCPEHLPWNMVLWDATKSQLFVGMRHNACLWTVYMLMQAVKEVNLMMKESQFSYGPSSLSSVMSATDKHRIEALRQRRVETDRARAGIPVSLQNPSVPVRFPKRDNAS